MSAFGFDPKDAVVEAILDLAREEKLRGKSLREAVESIMEATTYGIHSVLYELDAKKGE